MGNAVFDFAQFCFDSSNALADFNGSGTGDSAHDGGVAGDFARTWLGWHGHGSDASEEAGILQASPVSGEKLKGMEYGI
jgi:hypothetical protein